VLEPVRPGFDRQVKAFTEFGVLVRALAYILAYARECGKPRKSGVERELHRSSWKARTTSLFPALDAEVVFSDALQKKNR